MCLSIRFLFKFFLRFLLVAMSGEQGRGPRLGVCACANIVRVRRCCLLRNGNLVALLHYSNHVNGWRNAQQ